MAKGKRERLWTSLLWGGVAAVGQYTMLFLSIIGRIHVRFADNAPVFSVDPRGPIVLTKDTALASVWAMALAYGLLVAVLAYLRPRPSRNTWILAGAAAMFLSGVAAFAEPWWGLIVLADSVALYPLLASRKGTSELL